MWSWPRRHAVSSTATARTDEKSALARASRTRRFRSRHGRVSCSPVRRATALTGIFRARVTTSASNHSVKPELRSAHGTSARLTPHAGHRTRGTRACR